MIAFGMPRPDPCPHCQGHRVSDATVTYSPRDCQCQGDIVILITPPSAREQAEKAAKMAQLRHREEWLKRKGDRALRKGQR